MYSINDSAEILNKMSSFIKIVETRFLWRICINVENRKIIRFFSETLQVPKMILHDRRQVKYVWICRELKNSPSQNELSTKTPIFYPSLTKLKVA